MNAPFRGHGPKTRGPLRAMGLAVPLATLIGPAAHATWPVPEQTCARLWAKADANHDGVVMGAEATPYLAATRHDGRVVPDDGRIGRVTFMSAVASTPGRHTGQRSPKPAEASRQDGSALPRPWGLPERSAQATAGCLRARWR